MPGRRILLAAALASWLLCPLRADALDAHAVIAGCTATLGANLQGLAAIRQACPGIDQALASLGMSRLLPADWDAKVSAKTLGDLDVLAERYAGAPPSALPDAPTLRAIALRLQQPDTLPSSLSLWDHIKAWLRHQLAPLAGLLKRFRPVSGTSAGPGLRTVLLFGAGVLILVSVAAIIIAELRAAGFLSADRRRRRDTRGRPALTRVAAAAARVGDDIDAARALDDPASALRLLVAALRRSRRIERDGNLTCREVLARAVFDSPGQREGFASIAFLAERELFGPRGAPIRVPDELRLTLDSLYAELLAAPPATRPAAS